jgi:hypothetical protein
MIQAPGESVTKKKFYDIGTSLMVIVASLNLSS